MKHYGDVSKISGSQIEPVDIITFGSPCQDLSVAGKREGMKHAEQGDEETTRSGLFYEAIRIIEEMREATNGEYPKYAVWENVPGAFSSNKGRDFHAVLEAFCSVCDDTVSIPEPYDRKRTKLIWNKAGEIVGVNYSVAWRTLDAQYWGVPQRRKRIYLVADFTGRRAGEILFKQESLRGDLSQGNEAGQEVTADVVGGVDGGVGNGGQLAATVISSYGTKWNGNAGAYNGENFVLQKPGVDGGVGAANHEGAKEIVGFDSYNLCETGSIGRTVTTPSGGLNEHIPCIYYPFPDPSKNQGGIAVVVLNDQGGSSINVESEDLSPTLRANSHQHEPVIALQANGIDRADTAGCNGCGWRENESYTLNTVDRHAVCYENHQHGGYREGCGTLRASGGDYGGGSENVVCYDARGNGDGETACFTMQRSDEYQACEVASTQSARQHKSATDLVVEKQYLFENHSQDTRYKGPLDVSPIVSATFGMGGNNQPFVIREEKPPRKYIIRRLTPTECARLQGFPDWWSTLAPYDPADAEFWENVRKTHAEINGKKYKPVKDIKKWYDKLHTDSAEYKMWGNGIALPNVEYVLHGIAEQGAKTLGSLFDGSGGFPLAGVLNGIKPIWASEVEPYPIAVTVSRFGKTGGAIKK